MTLGVEELTIARLHGACLDGSATARGITQAYLKRIEAYDRRGPYLNSIINMNDRALYEADRLDAGLSRTKALSGPLHGVPVIVKDNLDTIDMPTTSGVALFRDFIPNTDAF